MELDLRRLIVRHRNVAPMVSALLAGTDAHVRILDATEAVILDRDGGPGDAAQRHPVKVEGTVIGWVEGERVAVAVAAVLSYAASREADKRSLSQEALDRYRELTLIYDLAQRIGERLEVDAVARVALGEIGRLPGGGAPFILLRDETAGMLARPASLGEGPVASAQPGGLLASIAAGEPEIVNDVGGDGRPTTAERSWASLIGAPLVVRGARLGLLGAVTTEAHEYRAGDLKVLAAIAALTGPAIDQAWTRSAVGAGPA
jgi:hypothetical protein